MTLSRSFSWPLFPDARRRELALGVALAGLALLTMWRILGNQFVQDDMGVLLGNSLIRDWSGVWRAFGEAYWPPAGSGELYRPASIAWYTIQWMIGDGSQLLFRMVSLALYAASTLALWRLLRALVTPGAAWVGAAYFAVHPVHSEALATAVNQSELLVGLLLTLAVGWHLRANRGAADPRTSALLVGLCFGLAVLTKEHGLVLPGLLFITDLFLDRDRDSLRTRLVRWRWLYFGLLVFGAAFWLVRSSVLGEGTGTMMAEAFYDARVAQRAYTMIGVPAEWLRLLLWPAHLQSDWNLLEWVPTRGWSLRETAGVFALVAFAAGMALAWRRRPVAAFGLAWMVVALAPVCNVLIPSGIVLAERTLYLPSIGFVIVVADLLAMVEGRWGTLPRARRLLLAVLGALLLGLGVVRSTVRLSDWKNRRVFLTQQLLDAPTSWRARIAYGLMLVDIGDTTRARVEIRRTITQRPDDPIVTKFLVDRMRLLSGQCLGPTIVYQELLAVAPRRSDARGGLVACLLWLGRYADARAEALRGAALGLDRQYFEYVVTVADSAAAAGAPAGVVRLKPIGDRATVIGPVPEGPP